MNDSSHRLGLRTVLTTLILFWLALAPAAFGQDQFQAHLPPPGTSSLPVVAKGDFYLAAGQRHELLRRVDQLVVQADSVESLPEGFTLVARLGRDRYKLQLDEVPDSHLAAWSALDQQIETLGRDARFREVVPVFVNPRFDHYAVATSELLVRLEDDVNPVEFFSQREFAGYRRGDSMDAWIVEARDGAGAAALRLAAALQNLPGVRWAEPNFYLQLERQFIPDDELFNLQWHLHNTGQSGGTPGADGKLPEAWSVEPGGRPDLLIAVLDDGMEIEHPDLKIRGNPAELDDGTDTSGNGYVDDVIGWDFVFGDNDPSASGLEDRHATAVAGIVAARGNNGIGVTGAAFNAGVMPVRIFDGQMGTNVANVASALAYASGRGRTPDDEDWHGADVVVNAFGAGGVSSAMEEAIAWAQQHGRGGLGTPHFSSTGNNGSGSLLAPAVLSAEYNNVIAVGSSTHLDLRANYSQFGPEIDLLASSSGDGANTITTNRLGEVGYTPVPGFPDYTNMFGGTSSAAPLAAGIGALVLSQAPCMSAGELRQLLRDTADKIGPEPYDENGFNPLYGYGRINGGRALAGFRSDSLFGDRFEDDLTRALDRSCPELP